MSTSSNSSHILRLHFPDWSAADSILNRRIPWPLWQIGDQPLLYHWLDHAVNERFGRVCIYTTDRPAEIRKAMKHATLWPLEWEVIPTNPMSSDEATRVVGLPWENSTSTDAEPKSWDLLDHWFEQEKSWFGKAFANSEIPEVNLAIGRNCNIHPTTKLHMPVYIGNNVQVAEGAEIGPYASIGSNSMLAGYNRVYHSKIEPRTFLGKHTELNRCYLAGGLLANLRHRAKIAKVEGFVADGWSRDHSIVSIWERFAALIMWLTLAIRSLFTHSAGKRSTMATFQGMLIRTYSQAPLWKQRMPWLLEVVKGRCRLFGVLPRTQRQFSELSTDWQEILASAPVGVFSYADSHGCHSPDDDMESVHAVFQATRNDPELGKVCRRFAWNLVLGRAT